MIIEKNLGRVPYLPTFEAMKAFTQARGPDTPDELWICEHPPVFTQGLAGQADHVLFNPQGPDHIPVVPTNRGGQVTYHGPGQVVGYPLINLQRAGFFVKEYVFRAEQALLKTLEAFGVTGHRVRSAPGIYVRLDEPFGHAPLPPVADGADPFAGLGKIAAIGIKVTRHCTYHGVSFNVDMDLSPYERINPCGYAGLRTIDLASLGVRVSWQDAAEELSRRLAGQLGE